MPASSRASTVGTWASPTASSARRSSPTGSVASGARSSVRSRAAPPPSVASSHQASTTKKKKKKQDADPAALGTDGMTKEVTRLLEEIRSVDVEWPLVQAADEQSGSRVERLRREEARLASEMRSIEEQRKAMVREQEEIEEEKLEYAPDQEDVAELKAEIRRLQGVIADEGLAQETVELLTEEQELLVAQAEQAEHQSHLLTAKAEEIAQLVLEDSDGGGGGALGKDSLELELQRVLADAEQAHEAVDAAKAAATEQKATLARSQIELVEAKEAAQQAQLELKDGHQELVVASSELAEMVSAARKKEQSLHLRMEELDDRKLQVGANKVKIAERIQLELKAIAEAEAITIKAEEEHAEEVARAAAVREQQKRASSGIPAPAYQAPAHTPRRTPGGSSATKAKKSLADTALRKVPRSPATRIPLAAALEAATHEAFVPQSAGAQVMQAHLEEAEAVQSPRTPSRQKLPPRLASSASATPSRQNLPARLSTAKKSKAGPSMPHVRHLCHVSPSC
jgi:hypothetical protein